MSAGPNFKMIYFVPEICTRVLCLSLDGQTNGIEAFLSGEKTHGGAF